MRSKIFVVFSALLALTLTFAPTLTPAQTVPAFLETPDLNDTLRRGGQLEIENRWGDAVTHWEEAVRRFPAETSLEERHSLARLHYDLGRRYNDSTFCSSLSRVTLSQAVDLYADLLGKIQSHYVDPPEWRTIVGRGEAGLEIALHEPAFVERNLKPEQASAVDSAIVEMRQFMGQRRVASRYDAQDVMLAVCQLAETRLGLSATAAAFEFICGAANALDSYSAFLTPSQLSELYSQIEGNFVGLGVELRPSHGNLLIVRVIPGSPAQRAGLQIGDSITAVNGQATKQFSTDQAANMLQGPAGSSVAVTFLRPGYDPTTATIQRERVEVPSIDQSRIVDGTDGIAYIKLVSFQKNTVRELDAALWNLHRQGMKRLIMDLRGNPGGLLVAAVEVADRFIERGTIVSTRGRNAGEDFIYTAHVEGTWQVPLVVMIDHDSASAAEIFAGAIRDHHRGTLVGARSFGKGSVQGIFPLNTNNSGVRLTTARFYSPNGQAYSRVGVTPDLIVQRVARPLTPTSLVPLQLGDDPCLTAAIQATRQLAAQPTMQVSQVGR